MRDFDKYLEQINPELLEDFKANSFNRFASAKVRRGLVQIGINGYGRYVVKVNDDTTKECIKTKEAVNYFRSLLDY